MHAEKCPVCGGSGRLPCSTGGDASSPPLPVTCHGCNGKGWVTVGDERPAEPQRKATAAREHSEGLGRAVEVEDLNALLAQWVAIQRMQGDKERWAWFLKLPVSGLWTYLGEHDKRDLWVALCSNAADGFRFVAISIELGVWESEDGVAGPPADDSAPSWLAEAYRRTVAKGLAKARTADA